MLCIYCCAVARIGEKKSSRLMLYERNESMKLYWSYKEIRNKDYTFSDLVIIKIDLE